MSSREDLKYGLRSDDYGRVPEVDDIMVRDLWPGRVEAVLPPGTRYLTRFLLDRSIGWMIRYEIEASERVRVRSYRGIEAFRRETSDELRMPFNDRDESNGVIFIGDGELGGYWIVEARVPKSHTRVTMLRVSAEAIRMGPYVARIPKVATERRAAWSSLMNPDVAIERKGSIKETSFSRRRGIDSETWRLRLAYDDAVRTGDRGAQQDLQEALEELKR